MTAEKSRQFGGWTAALLGLTIPISIAADNMKRKSPASAD